MTWTYLLIAGELDLSVGSIYGFGTIIMAWLIASGGLDPWIAAGLTLLFGASVGAINGVITVYVGVRAFVVTLGMLSALRGAAHYMSGSFPISFARGAESSLYPLGDSNPLGIPVPGHLVRRRRRGGHRRPALHQVRLLAVCDRGQRACGAGEWHPDPAHQVRAPSSSWGSRAGSLPYCRRPG